MHQSSKNLLTVERTSLSNYVFLSARPTAAVIDITEGDLDVTLAVYSTTEGSRFVNGFEDGLAYYAGLKYRQSDEWTYRSEFVYNDTGNGEDDLLDYQWGAALSADYDGGRWGVLLSGIIGDNGDSSNGVTNPNQQGLFGGVFAIPWYWLVQDKLQLVGRYQLALAENSEGFEANARFLGDAAIRDDVDTNGNRGDVNHSVYLGLNYHIIDHRLKLQAGIEYDYLNTPDGDVKAVTYQFGLRTFF